MAKKVFLAVLLAVLGICALYFLLTTMPEMQHPNELEICEDGAITLTMDTGTLFKTQGLLRIENGTEMTHERDRFDFILQVKHFGQWYTLNYDGDAAPPEFEDRIAISPGETQHMVNWSVWKGRTLHSGQYRIVQDYGGKYYAAPFTISLFTHREPQIPLD